MPRVRKLRVVSLKRRKELRDQYYSVNNPVRKARVEKGTHIKGLQLKTVERSMRYGERRNVQSDFALVQVVDKKCTSSSNNDDDSNVYMDFSEGPLGQHSPSESSNRSSSSAPPPSFLMEEQKKEGSPAEAEIEVDFNSSNVQPSTSDNDEQETAQSLPELHQQTNRKYVEEASLQNSAERRDQFFRPTIHAIPKDPNVLKESSLPFAVHVMPLQPVFANKRWGKREPGKCNHCSAYFSSFCKFSKDGSELQCCICNGWSATKIDDAALYDSYKFNACTKPGKEPAIIFVIENTIDSAAVVSHFVSNIQSIIMSLRRETHIGFIFYNTEIKYLLFTLEANQNSHSFVAIKDDDMKALTQDAPRVVIKNTKVPGSMKQILQKELLSSQGANVTECSVVKRAVKLGRNVLTSLLRPGKIIVIHASRSTTGNVAKWTDLPLLCLKSGISVDVFLSNGAATDGHPINSIAIYTSGKTYQYPTFQLQQQQFVNEIISNLVRPSAFASSLKIVTSSEIVPSQICGTSAWANSCSTLLGTLDEWKSVSIEFAYKTDSTIVEENVYLQFLFEYTLFTGQKIKRVRTFAVPVCSDLSQLLEKCDVDSVSTFLCKKYFKFRTKNLSNDVLKRAEEISRNEGVNWETLQLQATSFFRKWSATSSCTNGETVYLFARLMSFGVNAFVRFLLPKYYPICGLGRTLIQYSTAVCDNENLKEDSVYVLDNGIRSFLWIGANANKQQLVDIFGSSKVFTENIQELMNSSSSNEAWRLKVLLSHIRNDNENPIQVTVIKSGDKGIDLFQKHTIDDVTLRLNVVPETLPESIIITEDKNGDECENVAAGDVTLERNCDSPLLEDASELIADDPELYQP